MHYEVYIDVLFFTNFMMDSLLLLAVRKVLRYKTSIWRVLLGSLAGSALTCFLFLIPIPGILKTVGNLVGVSAILILVSFRVRTLLEWGKTAGVLFVSAFLLGGILETVRPYIRTGSLFFAVALVSYIIMSECWKLLLRLQTSQKKICEVVLYFNGKENCFHALIDTGNCLRDPVSKEPVHVIGRKTAEELGIKMQCREVGTGENVEKMNENSADNGTEAYRFYYIPYRTVNGAGIMPIIRAEKMCVKGERECQVERPVLGICGEMISEKEEYQIILNADIL